MKNRLLIMLTLVGLSLLIPQVWGVDLKRADDLRDFDKSYSIYEKQVRYHIPYKITNGVINDMQLNCDSASLVLLVSSEDSGIVKLDVPHRLLSGIFMVLVNGNEWDDLSITQNILAVNFPRNTNSIEIIGSYYITPYYLDSHLYTGVCDVVHDPPYSYILSPLKQFKSGILFNEIECKNGLELVGKMPSVHPKCVKPESLEKLTMRGWATTNKTLELTNPTKYPIEKNDYTFEIQYSLKGATLESIAHDTDVNSIHVELNNAIGGQMIISIPRDLLDAKIGSNNADDVFFLLIDGEENMYGEKITDDERIITVWFPKGANDIEIIGTFWT